MKYEDGTPVWPIQKPMVHTVQIGCRRMDCTMRKQFSASKLNGHGLHGLFLLSIAVREDQEDDPCDCFDTYGRLGNWTSVCFNTVTESFVHLTYDIREDTARQHIYQSRVCIPDGFKAWEDELIVAYFDDADSYKMVIQAFEVSHRNGKENSDYAEPTAEWSYLAGGPAKRVTSVSLDPRDCSVFSDESAVVAAGRDGMIVWYFGED